MSNPNDPYDPNSSRNPWATPSTEGQAPSNDWSAPQQGYGQQDPAGSMQHSPGTSGMNHQNAALDNNDIVAIILSAIFPGAGQIMLGQTMKGVVILVVSVLSCCIGGIFNIAAALDTYAVAMAKKKRAVGEWEFLPDFLNK